MLIPIRTDNRLTLTPVVNYAVIAANVAVFALAAFFPARYERMSQPYLLDPSAPEVHQFFTSMFMHADWVHIVGNMVFLWVFGNAVNDRFGHVAYAAFYLAGGVGSGIGYVLLGGMVPVLGASGAIAGVTGCYLVLFPRVRVTLLAWLLYFIVPFEVSSLVFLGFQFIFNVWASLSGAGGRVAYVAHAAGYVYGIGIAAALLGLRLLPRDVYDLLSLWKAAHRRAAYRRMVAQGYDPFNPQRNTRSAGRQPWQAAPDAAESEEIALRRRISQAHASGDLPTASRLYLDLVAAADNVVLPQQQQLDVSNQLMADQRYGPAADAYERLLHTYGGYEHAADIRLMLGILYGRYLGQRDRARTNLMAALERLTDAGKKAMARAELRALDRQ
ncbi:MAG: rhomboid family intramembrane serine protease [Planctomycetes bacterium]|nr:rhomboid family intramembrane serine protease [Planctomycetota bacterium]